MERTIFKGLGVALVTPFMENGAIDFAAVAQIVDNLIAGGVDYILVLGTTGETPTLSTDERKALIRFVRDRVAGRVKLMVGVGGNCTHDVVKTLRTSPAGCCPMWIGSIASMRFMKASYFWMKVMNLSDLRTLHRQSVALTIIM